MIIDNALIGRRGETRKLSWTADEALLYALAVGCSQDDQTGELDFTTESRHQQVIPSLICVAGWEPAPQDYVPDVSKILHVEMGFELHRPLAPRGDVLSTDEIVAVNDKGSAALITLSTNVEDGATGESVATLSSKLFVRDAGGFGGERGVEPAWMAPGHEPDAEVTYRTRPNQALLYRLTGDRNPLHSNPAVALRAGFERPILHGMCTYGFTVRALLHEVAGGDPARFRSFTARFAQPVTPGDALTVAIWKHEGGARFQTRNQDGTVVLDRGEMTFTS